MAGTFFYDRTIVDTAPAANVSTLTTLLPFTDVSDYNSVSAHLINLDATNEVTLIFDTSVGGGRPNLSKRYTATAGPGEECSIDTAMPMWAKYVRLSAQTTGPGYPTVQVQWTLLGKTNNRR
jgi:hypothetical protein